MTICQLASWMRDCLPRALLSGNCEGREAARSVANEVRGGPKVFTARVCTLASESACVCARVIACGICSRVRVLVLVRSAPPRAAPRRPAPPRAAPLRPHLILVVIAHLQEALEPGRGVFGSLPLVSMRQQHREARLTQPLLLSRADELIDHALGGVCKVAELRFPHHERGWVLKRVAELEAEHGKLREGGVACVELGLGGVNVHQRLELVSEGLLVVHDAVAVGEGAAFDVLAGDADVIALEEKCAPSELLCKCPVDALATAFTRAGGHAGGGSRAGVRDRGEQ